VTAEVSLAPNRGAHDGTDSDDGIHLHLAQRLHTPPKQKPSLKQRPLFSDMKSSRAPPPSELYNIFYN